MAQSAVAACFLVTVCVMISTPLHVAGGCLRTADAGAGGGSDGGSGGGGDARSLGHAGDSAPQWAQVARGQNWYTQRGEFGGAIWPKSANGECDSIVVAGGGNSKGYFNDVLTYTPVLDFQTAKPNQLHASFAPRINFAQVFFKNHMYIMGGMKEDREVTNDMWISIDMAQWTFQGNSTWPARQGLGAVVVKDNSGNDAAVVIMGGLADDAAYNDVWQYLGPTSTGGPGSWTQLTAAADWSPRWAFGVAFFNNKLWLSGGQSSAGVQGDIFVSNRGIIWKQIGALQQTRSFHVMTPFMGRLFITGGITTSATTVPELAWSDGGGTFVTLDAPPALRNRRSHIAVPFNHGLYVMGGSEAVGKAYLDDLWHLQPCSQLGMCAAFGGRAECQFLSMTNMSTGCVCSEGYVGSNCSAVPPFKPLGPHPNPPNYTAWYIVGALCVCAIVLLAIVVCVARRNRNKSQLTKEAELTDDWIIPAKKLKLDPRPIGAGGFAQVFRASLGGSVVAVKQIHGYLMATEDREALYMDRFKREAVLMAKLHHPHVQGLLGVCLQPQLCLITEFAPFGSLSDVLGSTAHVDDLPADNLLKMCFQIAAGMHFLHTRRPKIIHRDLNTNNVLVYALEYELLNVKIADFGLSKEVVKDTSMTGYLGSPSYIAPEILTDSASYNEKVDVYSFGIIVWAVCRYMEIGTITPLPNKTEHHKLMNPYPGMTPWQIVARVKEGFRPTVPDCPLSPSLISLMKESWAPEPSSRPSFRRILDMLEHQDSRLRRPKLLRGNVYRSSSNSASNDSEPGFTEVAPRLLIGGLEGARNTIGLRKKGVTHVLNVAHVVSTSATTKPSWQTKVLELDDDAEFNILPHIPEAVDFIEQGRRQGTVFVHCMQGQSRSVVIVAAYFMVVYNLSSRAAINLLKRRHKASQPIASFLEQLKSLEDPNQPERILAAQAARRVSQGAAPLPLSNMASASTHRRHTSSDGGSGGVGGSSTSSREHRGGVPPRSPSTRRKGTKSPSFNSKRRSLTKSEARTISKHKSTSVLRSPHRRSPRSVRRTSSTDNLMGKSPRSSGGGGNGYNAPSPVITTRYSGRGGGGGSSSVVSASHAHGSAPDASTYLLSTSGGFGAGVGAGAGSGNGTSRSSSRRGSRSTRSSSSRRRSARRSQSRDGPSSGLLGAGVASAPARDLPHSFSGGLGSGDEAAGARTAGVGAGAGTSVGGSGGGGGANLHGSNNSHRSSRSHRSRSRAGSAGSATGGPQLCPNCHMVTPADPNQRFCTRCGSRLDG